MKNIISCLIRGVLLALILICVGYLIAFFIIKNPNTIDVTLFILGGIPIVLFLPSVFSQSRSGALHTPKVIFRKVDTVERKELQKNESVLSALSYVLAGVITWVFSSIIS